MEDTEKKQGGHRELYHEKRNELLTVPPKRDKLLNGEEHGLRINNIKLL